MKRGKYLDFLRYKGPLKLVRVIKINGYSFIIDGRHRSRANLDKGLETAPAIILPSNDSELEKLLFQISKYFLSEIPIRR